jgi:glycerol kinase
MAAAFVLAIDQGTTSTRAVVYDSEGRARGRAGRELGQSYPRPGWVEHDPEEIWNSAVDVVRRALQAAGIDGGDLTAIGVTNQRETVILWDRASGAAVAPAVVWQDRRTSDFCRARAGDGGWLAKRTGLVLDPYFSATKIAWLLDRDAATRAAAEAGRLAVGTVDSFLLWRLTGGRVHATDRTNASRTLLLGLKSAAWDDELLRYFGVPAAMLPEVRPSAADFGKTFRVGVIPDGVPILGMAGDQQAAKCTYGTGAFFLRHLGPNSTPSRHRLLTTLAATGAGAPEYALEGSVFVAGAAVQWLRDGLRLFDQAPAVEALAEQADPEQPLVFVPGFVGLGAPHWVPEARGVLFGVTRGTTAADLGRATLEGVACQVADLIEATADDAGTPLHELRVDGGMAGNGWFLQCQADLLGLPVQALTDGEATARGAAYLAGLQAGVWSGTAELRKLSAPGMRFESRVDAADRLRRLERWQRAVKAVIAFYTPTPTVR